MCCCADAKAKRELLASLGRSKMIPAWKLLHKTGEARFVNYRYHPGWNFPAKRLPKHYNINNPCGLHVYQNKRLPIWDSDTWVRVYGHVDDLIRVDGHGQAVFSRLLIRKKNWLAAGLPDGS